jgi:hypothetical protein
VLKVNMYGFNQKIGKYVTDWDSGKWSTSSSAVPTAVADTSTTSNSICPVLCRLFGTMNTFIDKTRYRQRPNDANSKSWKEKNAFFLRLKRDIVLKPSQVPRALWERYLRKSKGYESFKSFIRRFELSAQGLSAKNRVKRTITFFKAGSGTTLTRIQP